MCIHLLAKSNILKILNVVNSHSLQFLVRLYQLTLRTFTILGYLSLVLAESQFRHLNVHSLVTSWEARVSDMSHDFLGDKPIHPVYVTCEPLSIISDPFALEHPFSFSLARMNSMCSESLHIYTKVGSTYHHSAQTLSQRARTTNLKNQVHERKVLN